MNDAPEAGAHGPREPGSVHVITSASRTRIVLSGEVDADLGPDLNEATRDAEAAGRPIEVDCQHVSFMDSSGVAFLARLATRSPERMRVLHVPPAVRFLLDVTRIGELLDVVDGEVDVDASLPSTPTGDGPREPARAGATPRRDQDEPDPDGPDDPPDIVA